MRSEDELLQGDNTVSETEFRTEVREWLEDNCPQSMRNPYASEVDICWGGRNFEFQSEDQRVWLEKMGAKGWTAPTWPAAYGGGGLNGEQAAVLRSELKRISARPALESFGISMLGPALLKFGTEELKQQHLPKICRGEIRWAQGYSEPNAGSDLASLQMRAEDHGDHFRVTGSKIWTSYGNLGDWMFCLVRTDFDAPKHLGISFVLFDMTTEGVSTQPIRLISGKSPFTETILDDVRVEKNQLVGEFNRGWDVAKYLLTHEREMIGSSGFSSIRTGEIGETARDLYCRDGEPLSNSALRSDIARFEVDEQALNLTIERLRQEFSGGAGLGAQSSMLKYYGTELNKRRMELLMSVRGSASLSWTGEQSREGHLPRAWLRSKGNSIEGGTSEIQLNIIAKRLLRLPE